MSVTKIVIGISAGLIILTGLIYHIFNVKQTELLERSNANVSIGQTWRLPEILEEVSGIAFLRNNRMACVQDEDGSIFIYNLENSEIENKVDFAGSGDYEGISVVDGTAYILRSDGTLYRVKNFEGNPDVSVHQTPLTRRQDVEGLCYDANNSRLLLAIKEKEPESDLYKGVYGVDLQTMKMQENPVFKLQLEDSVFGHIDEEKAYRKFMPSEIALNSETGEIYMLAGSNPQFLILDSDGSPKRLFSLNKDDFSQPEGLTIDPSGNVYISSEGNPATIHKVSIN